MAWYRAGSVTVTNGSAVVTGAGTSFVANVHVGHAINLPDGRVYEVLSVASNTELTLGSVYLGGSAGGQAYSVQPNQGFAQAAATRLSDFLSQVSGWVTGALAGRFADGSISSPGLAFAADQDTGLARTGENQVALIAGGAPRLTATSSYLITQAPFLPPASGNPSVAAFRNDASTSNLRLYTSFPGGTQVDLNSGMNGVSNSGFDIRLNDVSRLAIDAAGSLLVGATAGNSHTIQGKSTANGSPIIAFTQPGVTVAGLYVVDFNGVESANSANAAMKIGKSSSGRSLAASGTMNASGADYAEYMLKADDCGPIAKGDVCGVDVDGKLTKTWAAALSFVVKSTDPAYVGGDIWAAHLAPRPIDPGDVPAAPGMAKLAEDATAEDREAAAAAYQAATTAYTEARVAHDAAVAQYEADLPVWEAELEAARQCVDRIAFAGQVPVNVAGDFAVGDYLIAAAKGGGIHTIAVAAADITLDQYRRRLGKVWAIRDGRPWVDVQHG